MDGQPERCYAVEQLKALQGSIADLTQGMVIRRARLEKLAAARDTFAELQQVRKRLAQAIGDARLLLMETEEYQTAKTAAMLQTGLLRFNLMSNVYRPVYDAIQNFIKVFPVDDTANAAVIGRLMNNVKLGYYPTDPDNISRAEEAQTRLHRVGFGSFFYSQVSQEAFHLLFLNPPYLSVLNESGSKSRHEKRFLIESLPHLMYGGLLVYVIPYYRLTPDICRVLVDNFEGLTVCRFTDSEFKKFKQIAVMGLRKRRADVPEDTLVCHITADGSSDALKAHSLWHLTMMEGTPLPDCGLYFMEQKCAVINPGLEKAVAARPGDYALCAVTLEMMGVQNG